MSWSQSVLYPEVPLYIYPSMQHIHTYTHVHTHMYARTDLSDKAGKLVDHSRAYKKQARYLNLRQSLAAKIAIGVVVFLLLIFLRYLIF